MSKNPSLNRFEKWVDTYLNFEHTPKKNIFWLDTMKFFCEKFDHPENFAPCFHVAGSKGKGSISTFIASILDTAGYKTGLYTSPHILDFIERITSASGYFDDSVYEKAVDEIMSGVQKIRPEELPGERPITWFELVTLFSFLVFRQAKVDWSVYEVGLGGRLDSTNVVTPVCACIGPIELEHTEFLGDTVEKIAFEKAGIIKEKVTVVIAKQLPEVRRVFEKAAGERHAKAYFVEDWVKNLKNCMIFNTTSQEKSNIPLMEISFSSPLLSRPVKTKLHLLGDFQARNAALASIAVKLAVPSITEDQIEAGLSKAVLPARFEFIPKPEHYETIPQLILDGAHTVNSVKFTLNTIEQLKLKNKKFNLLFACAADKDMVDIASLFKDKTSSVFLTKPGDIKLTDLSKLKAAFDSAEIKYDINEDYRTQIKKALSQSAEEKLPLLVTGSFYLVSEVKKYLLDK